MKKHIRLGLVLVLLGSIFLHLSANTLIPASALKHEYPTQDIVIEPRLLIYRAKLYLQEDDVWLKLSVMNLDKTGYMFLIGCKVPCFPGGNWGHPHYRILLDSHERFACWLKVRPCEDGGRTNLVPVFISVSTIGTKQLVYFGGFMLEIPEHWDFISTT